MYRNNNIKFIEIKKEKENNNIGRKGWFGQFEMVD